MTQVRVGTKWKTVDKTFIVTCIVEKDNHIWIHYNNADTKQEYSCYEESFIHRFSEIVNEH
jgi:spore coat polysaccharide biosynthesis protein SpsF (cytidylyltransferase family)